jgi:hypothetical protein
VKNYLTALIRSGDRSTIARAHRIFGDGRLTAIPQLREILEELADIAGEELPLGEGQIELLATRLASSLPHRGDRESWLRILQELMVLPAQPSWLGWMEKSLLDAVVQIETWKLGERASHGLKGRDLLRDLDRLTIQANSLDIQNGTAPAEPSLVCIADVAPQAVDWLWNPYIPIGKLTLLEGDPGVAKSWLSLYLGAIVTRGLPFPDVDGVPRQAHAPTNVIYLSAEDGLADTLRPRLDSAEADVHRVFVLTGKAIRNGTAGGKKVVGVTLADLPELEAALKSTGAIFMVVDPIQAFLGSQVDMWRANEIRTVLAGLVDLADRFRCAVLCIRHLSKDENRKALYRGLGSIDFAAAARSILLAGLDPRNPNRRAIVHLKSNLAPLGPSVGYELREGQFFWTGRSDLSANSLSRPEDSEAQHTALEEAVHFLQTILADGPMPAEEVAKAAKKARIAEPTLARARFDAGVRSFRRSRPGGKRGDGDWLWCLKNQDGGEVNPPPPTDDHLEQTSKPEGSKEVTDRLQDDQMIPLNEELNSQETQEVMDSLQDDHPELPGKGSEGTGDDED